uniref:Uncharacterized protein LOC104237707 n=1 Tax=Nicotiana sylvestris TaxID=4096 RepID=A0A1U7XKR7_NICSY|nr:PREDICTED: uncharacterized protein LOC104237707 [Nicotiana sylvestris]
MAPKKKARISQAANATSRVADDSLLDIVDEGSRPAIALPDSSIPEQTTPVPTPVEGTTIPPVDTHVLPPAPASGSGANPVEDFQDFIDEMHKTLRVIYITEIEGVELDAHRLKGVACPWFELWEDAREEGHPPARWSEFADAFIGHFLPAKTRVDRAVEFENLTRGNRSVWAYHMEFACLSNLQPVHRRQGLASSSGVVSGPFRAAGDPINRVGQERGSSSSRGPRAPGAGRCTHGLAFYSYLYVIDVG